MSIRAQLGPLAPPQALDTLGRPLTREEVALADLLTVLIQQFEDVHYPLGHASPLDALRELMEVRPLRMGGRDAELAAASPAP